jgi:hypothetical protein
VTGGGSPRAIRRPTGDSAQLLLSYSLIAGGDFESPAELGQSFFHAQNAYANDGFAAERGRPRHNFRANAFAVIADVQTYGIHRLRYFDPCLLGRCNRSGIAVDLVLSPQLDRLPQHIEIALFRVIQESLNNIHRHPRSRPPTSAWLSAIRLHRAGADAAPEPECGFLRHPLLQTLYRFSPSRRLI